MANIRKSFNFRNGFQVDDKNVVINSNGLVGIGTTVPLEVLDVYGNFRLSGIASVGSIFTQNLAISGNASFPNGGAIGLVSFTSDGIVTARTSTGIITYYGDGGKLLNLPTSQWLDVDTGIGYTSIYAQGNVGIATFFPIFTFQVGGSGNTLQSFSGGFGVYTSGDVYTTGVITSTSANGGFSGSGALLNNLNASNLASGTVPTDRLPVIPNDNFPANLSIASSVTAPTFYGQFIGTVTGNLVGIASTALDLVSTANISINQIVAGFATCGLTTVAKLDAISSTNRATIGINTRTHRSDLHIVKAGISSILLTSDVNEVSLFTLGRDLGNKSGGLRFGKSSTLDPFNLEKYSIGNTLDIINYDSGSLNYYVSNSGAKFHWFYRNGVSDANPIMTLTSNGKLIVGSGTTVAGEETLCVTGILTVTNSSNAFFDNNVSVKGDLNVYGNTNISISGQNLNATSGISTAASMNVSGQLLVAGPTSGFVSGADITIGDGITVPRVGCVILTESGIGIGTTSIRTISVGSATTVRNFDSFEAPGIFRSLGVGSNSLSACVDFGSVGQSSSDLSNYRFMIVPKLTSTNINSLTASSGGLVYDTTNNLFKGYNGSSWTKFEGKNYAENNTGSGSYNLQVSDIGKLVKASRSGSPATVTIPNSLVATVGDTIIIHNTSTGGQTDITITHETSANLVFAGGLTGARTLSQYGVATLICVASNTFAIYGNGIT